MQNVRKLLTLEKTYKSIWKYTETFGSGGIYRIIQKCPEHTTSQAIQSLICKRAKNSDYQYMVVWRQSTTFPIVKFRINYTRCNPAILDTMLDTKLLDRQL